jgi:hypothetical protein
MDQGVTSYPKVMLYLDGSTEGTFIEVSALQPLQVLRSVGVEVGNDLEGEDEDMDMDMDAADVVGGDSISLRGKTGKGGEKAEGHFLPRTKKDIYNDAYLSFDFAMRNSIFTEVGPLTNTTKDAFSGFLQFLQSCLPPSFGLQKMISELVENIDTVVQSEEDLLKIVDKHPPKKKSWSRACTRGDPLAGYTCGLWELFHIMSVGFVEWNNWVIGDDWSYYDSNEAAEMVRNFIEHFFGCEVCRMNFLHAYEACAHDRCNRLPKYIGGENDWKEFPMWLFETHNSVNVRLMNERAERENNRIPTRKDEIAVEWPSRKECPRCWHGDGRWEQDNVYVFLRLTYW